MELSRYKIQFATQMDVLYSTFAFISARGVSCMIMARIYSRFFLKRTKRQKNPI
jgi:hypothetical protein